MAAKTLSQGVAHKIPDDMKKALVASAKSVATWEDISPLARNEWICWVVSVNREETRKDHIKRAVADLKAGKRRPCCWSGCIHRSDKPLNATQKFLLKKQKGKRV